MPLTFSLVIMLYAVILIIIKKLIHRCGEKLITMRQGRNRRTTIDFFINKFIACCIVGVLIIY